MTRRILSLDTETTGISTRDGHRLVEVGIVEMIADDDGLRLTGRVYHSLVNPDRDIPEEATRVHGHTRQSLQQAPRFEQIMPELLEFLQGAEVIAHNAAFDEGHLNNEMQKARSSKTLWEYCSFTDTVQVSRRVHPQLKRHNLDALLDHYQIDRSSRELHGALLDAELLAQVYMRIWQEHDLAAPTLETDVARPAIKRVGREGLRLAVVQPSTDEIEAHSGYMEQIAGKPAAVQNQNRAAPRAADQPAATNGTTGLRPLRRG